MAPPVIQLEEQPITRGLGSGGGGGGGHITRGVGRGGGHITRGVGSGGRGTHHHYNPGNRSTTAPVRQLQYKLCSIGEIISGRPLNMNI